MSRIRSVCLGLLVSVGLFGLVTIASAQTPAAAERTELTSIPAEATLAVVCYPRRVLTQPEHAKESAAIVADFPLRQFGIDLAKLRRVLVVMLPPQRKGPTFAVSFQFDQPVSQDEMLQNLHFSSTAEQIDGRDYYRGEESAMSDYLVAFVGDRTMLLGHDAVVPKMVRREPAESELIALVRDSAVADDLNIYFVVEPMRAFLQAPLRDPAPLVVALNNVLQNLATLEAGIPFWGPGRATVKMRGVDEAGAKQIEAAALQAVTVFRNLFVDTMKKIETDPAVEQARRLLGDEKLREAFGMSVEKARTELFAEYLPRRENDRLSIAVDVNKGAGDALLETIQKKTAAKDKVRK